jgi:hypothetical protein
VLAGVAWAEDMLAQLQNACMRLWLTKLALGGLAGPAHKQTLEALVQQAGGQMGRCLIKTAHSNTCGRGCLAAGCFGHSMLAQQQKWLCMRTWCVA